MAIENNTEKVESNRSNRWTSKNEWDVLLDCGGMVLSPANRAIDSIKSDVSILNMLRNCFEIQENKAGNYTVYYRYKNGTTKVVAFLGGCKGLDVSELTDMVREIKDGDVVKTMTATEMEEEFNA